MRLPSRYVLELIKRIAKNQNCHFTHLEKCTFVHVDEASRMMDILYVVVTIADPGVCVCVGGGGSETNHLPAPSFLNIL